MEKTRSHSVVVNVISIRDHTKLAEVEMRITRLQRIECPRNTLHPKLERRITLSMLQQVTEIIRSIRRTDPEHVRMNDRLTIQNSRKPKNKTHHAAIRKRSDQRCSNFLLWFEGERGIDLEIFNAPDLALELFDLVHFVEALDIPNCDGGHQISRPAIN